MAIGVLAAAGALASACGGGSAPGSIQVRWLLGFGVPCNHPQAMIDTIRVRVLIPAGNREVAAQTFACTAGSGTVMNIPAGTYNLELEGGVGSSFTTPVFTGSVGGVVVASGKVVDVGSVTLSKVPPTENPGALQISWDFETGLCAANGVVNVRVQVWRELVFKAHDETYPCDSPTVQLNVPPGRYGIVVLGLDKDGNVVRRGTKDDADVQQGSTTSVQIVLRAS
jgi:hypothetical protein